MDGPPITTDLKVRG